MPDKTCAHCIYSEVIFMEGELLCHRYPIVKKVSPQHWCGEHPAMTKESRRSTRKQEREKNDPLAETKWAVIRDWNKMAELRGWSSVSQIPTGKVGDMLTSRVKDPAWMAAYQDALMKLSKINWINPPNRLSRFRRFVEPDSVRQFIDGEYDDRSSNLSAE